MLPDGIDSETAERIAAMVDGRQTDQSVRELLERLSKSGGFRRLKDSEDADDIGEGDNGASRRREFLRKLMLKKGAGIEVARLLRAERQWRSHEIDRAAGRDPAFANGKDG